MSSSTELTPSNISSLATDYSLFEEIILESRNITADWTSVTEDIVVVFQLDPDALPTSTTHVFLGDASDTMALQRAFVILPLFKILPDANNLDVILTRDSISIKEKNNYGWWVATCSYKHDSAGGGSGGRGLPETPDPNVAADNTLNTIQLQFGSGANSLKHITQSISTTIGIKQGAVGPELIPPDIKRAIGATREGITGIDVPSDSLEIQVTAYYRPSFIDFNFVTKMKKLKGCTNSQTFLGQDPEEVLFLDWSGGGAIFDIIPITYTFSVQENIVGLGDDPFQTLTAKGHDYIEYMYLEKAQAGPGINLRLPAYRIIHKVHKPKSFVDFGFGI